MQIIEHLSDISNQYDAIFCDVWGCIHNGVEGFNEAAQALTEFRSQNGISLLLTNAPRPWQNVAIQLLQLGIPQSSWDAIITSGDATKFALFEGHAGQRVFHIGPERDAGFFESAEPWHIAQIERVNFEAAEGIVCTGLFDDACTDTQHYREMFEQAVALDMPFLCANPDLIVDRGHCRELCAGALAKLYRSIGGRVFMHGKPWPAIYQLAIRKISELTAKNIPKHRILCIGDGVETDIKGANAQSLPSLFVSEGLCRDQFKIGDRLEFIK